MRRTRLYVAGPMRGMPEFNVPAFDLAAARLRARGYEVFNPADYDRELGVDHAGTTGGDLAELPGFDLRAALKADLSWIADCADGIALLDGWEDSRGARAEHALAEAIGVPAWSVDYWVRAAGVLATEDGAA